MPPILKLLPFALLCAALPAAAAQGPAPANVSACFSPGPESCAELIANAIDGARSTVRLQAYTLTSTKILRALAAAKRRGVDVEAILDRSQDKRDEPGPRYSSAVYLAHAGVPVWIDDSRSSDGGTSTAAATRRRAGTATRCIPTCAESRGPGLFSQTDILLRCSIIHMPRVWANRFSFRPGSA